ncbi:MAG: eL32 family ribosomal protein [Candidatus Methanodesulfokora sp.]|jgi:large subunit ribosomal protein L32e
MQKKKKPRFINLARYWHLGSVKSWRKPRGIDNKQRLKLKSRPKLPGKGYKNPDEIRGLHPSGLKPIIVHNPKELEEFVGMYGADNILVYIAGGVGKKKRKEIVERGKSLGVRIVGSAVGEG